MLNVKKVSKIYEGKIPYRALSDIELTIEAGEFVGIMGPSGSGKTTLLNIIATIDEPTTGEILINGDNPHGLKNDALAKFRRQQLGFVFQEFNLLHTLTVEENIVLPLTLDGKKVEEMKEKANQIAQKLGITDIMKKRIYEISGGQAQRAAVARAMIHNPKLLLADEPTGNLDSKASKDVMTMLTEEIKVRNPNSFTYRAFDSEEVSEEKDVALINEILRQENIESDTAQTMLRYYVVYFFIVRYFYTKQIKAEIF